MTILFTNQVPSFPNSTDSIPYELGMKFRSATGGEISAIRYYKASSEKGTHTGRIWTSTGTLLTSVIFTNETASGWQNQALTTPISIQANTTYVVSVNVNAYYVFTNEGLVNSIVNGDLSSVADGNNGVFNGTSGAFPTNSYRNTNYFRDINFVAVALPTITKISGDNQTAALAAVLPNPLVVQVKNSAGSPQSGVAVNFAVISGGGSVSPASAVTNASGQASTTLTLGASPGATSPVSNTVSATATGVGSVTFSATANPSLNSQNVLTTQVPSVPNFTDNVPYELGMKFRSAKGGQITTIRYYKAASETGTHTGKVWTATGTLLASVAFSNETASGWQQQLLQTPLNILANTTYVVSVNANAYYVITSGQLASSIVNGDLSSVADGNNGVYNVSPNSFPASSYQNSNYFRDIAFVVGSTLVKVSGDNQSGVTGATLPNSLVVRVVNAQNNPQSGITVNFAVTSGGGSVSPVSVVTDGSGQASTTLTLGAVPSAPGGVVVTATAAGIGSITFSASATPANPNPIYLENQNPGTTNWKLNNRGIDEIAAYASATGVNKGGSLDIKVSLGQPGQYTIDVYRLGYYGGTGGRLMASSGPLTGTTQAPCSMPTSPTYLIECNWTTSYVLQIGSNWTSGIYVAKLTHQATSKIAHVWFVVRDDSSTADILFQSSVSTVLAYSTMGDYSLYSFNSVSGVRALKVSYDRPFSQATYSESTESDSPLRWEYNMLRWLESQSYNVTYTDSMQVHTNGQKLLNHKVFLSVGHDEYWSKEIRDNVEAARSAKVNLGFFSANTAYWRVRFESSTPAAGQVNPNRVMACYKQDWALDSVAQQQGPSAATNKFRSVQNQRPENALLGVMYGSDLDLYGGFNFVVTNTSDTYYANTGLQNGDQLNLLVGYEWDFIVNNGSTPPGLVILSQSTVVPSSLLPNFDEPLNERSLPANQDFTKSHSARYTASSGAKVFASGTIQWAWGLDSEGVSPSREDTRAKQITVNVLADMGARPQVPNANLIVP